MLVLDKPVIVPPVILILALDVTVPVSVMPLTVGVVNVLRVRVTDWSLPTIEPSPDTSPCTCVSTLARMPESAS
jgi:hypothetical protein